MAGTAAAAWTARRPSAPSCRTSPFPADRRGADDAVARGPGELLAAVPPAPHHLAHARRLVVPARRDRARRRRDQHRQQPALPARLRCSSASSWSRASSPSRRCAASRSTAIAPEEIYAGQPALVRRHASPTASAGSPRTRSRSSCCPARGARPPRASSTCRRVEAGTRAPRDVGGDAATARAPPAQPACRITTRFPFGLFLKAGAARLDRRGGRVPGGAPDLGRDAPAPARRRSAPRAGRRRGAATISTISAATGPGDDPRSSTGGAAPRRRA